MAHGFKFQLGPSNSDIVEITSAETSIGVLLESFRVDYVSGEVITKSYPNFPGSTLYVVMTGVNELITNIYWSPAQSFTVNNATKTVTITNGTNLFQWQQGSAMFTILGY